MNYLVDGLALGFSTTVFIGYHFYLRKRARRDPSTVLSYFAAEARSAWVETVMQSSDDGILAVQTLRNTTMAATFLASTAVLLMIGILSLSNQFVGAQTENPWRLLNFFGAVEPRVWLAKTLCMLIVMFFAFFCFSTAIRIFNHVGYMINVREPTEESLYSNRLVAQELNRGGFFYSIGMRAFYYLIPLVCWLFGPLYLVVSTIVLVFALLPWVDRIPIPDRVEDA